MKRILSAIIVILITATITTIPAKASDESATELYKKDRDAFYAKYMCLDDEAEEEGLYSDANNGAYSKTKSKKSGKSTTTSSTSQSSYSGEARGWVYSTDELHIVGLPEDPETGYTRAGDYGTIYNR
jgi:hypothetical protein